MANFSKLNTHISKLQHVKVGPLETEYRLVKRIKMCTLMWTKMNIPICNLQSTSQIHNSSVTHIS